MTEKAILTPIRIWDFNLIPRDLMLQLKTKEFLGYTEEDLDRLYLFGQLVAQDKFSQIYALVDDEKKIRGVLWLSIDVIMKHLWVTLLVIDKSCQNYKKNMREVFEFSKKIKESLKLKKLRAQTHNPKAYERLFGAKRSKLTTMEVI